MTRTRCRMSLRSIALSVIALSVIVFDQASAQQDPLVPLLLTRVANLEAQQQIMQTLLNLNIQDVTQLKRDMQAQQVALQAQQAALVVEQTKTNGLLVAITDLQSRQPATPGNLEKRLAALEAKLDAKLNSNARQRVQAPFQVFDENGKVIFRVGLDAEHKVPEAVIGDEESGHIWFVTGKDRSFARFYRSKDRGGVQIVASLQEAYVAVKKPEEDVTAYLGSEADNEFGVFLSHGKTNAARLVIRPSFAGRLTLSDTDGSVTVEGGTMDNGKGQVKTGPWCCKPPGSIGPHQYIEGRNHE